MRIDIKIYVGEEELAQCIVCTFPLNPMILHFKRSVAVWVLIHIITVIATVATCVASVAPFVVVAKAARSVWGGNGAIQRLLL